MAGRTRTVHLELPHYLDQTFELCVATTCRNHPREYIWPDEGGKSADVVLGEGEDYRVMYGVWRNGKLEGKSPLYMEKGQVYAMSLRPIPRVFGCHDGFGVLIRPAVFSRKEQ